MTYGNYKAEWNEIPKKKRKKKKNLRFYNSYGWTGYLDRLNDLTMKMYALECRIYAKGIITGITR